MFKKLIKWSESNYSHLPWRIERNLYTTLVSEIMLQQTTVSTVLNHFNRFISKYPDIKALASINEEQILIDWKGLGYYRRAKNLLKAVKEIKEKFDGKIPLNFEQLKEIHGIGDYTANALISIGGNENAISLDANLERVLARFYGVKAEKGPKLQKELYRQFKAGLICREINLLGARAYNEALMDLGRSICKARSASCELCPLAKECFANNRGQALSYPVEKKSQNVDKPKYYQLNLLRVIVSREDEILVYKKSPKQWLAGQYELPTYSLFCEDADFDQYPDLSHRSELSLLPFIKTSITKYRISNHILYANEDELSKISKNGFMWKKRAGLNLSTASQKCLDAF
ncbi:MAG: A/G-specific adenine glycosylase [Bacteriovoracaceae bacterium]|jgi:A/G-specific adenine glycosylase